MSPGGEDSASPSTVRPRELRALGAVLVWLVAAMASRRFGVWSAVAPTALALAAMTLLFDRALLQDQVEDGGHTRRWRPLRALAVGLAVGVVMAAATYGLYPHLERAFPGLAGDKATLYREFYALEGNWRRLTLIPVAIAEELVWRGLVQGALLRRLGARALSTRTAGQVAVVLTALLYAAVQLPVGAPLLLIAAFACGLVWGGLRSSQHDVAASVAAHVAWDTVVLLIMPVGSG